MTARHHLRSPALAVTPTNVERWTLAYKHQVHQNHRYVIKKGKLARFCFLVFISNTQERVQHGQRRRGSSASDRARRRGGRERGREDERASAKARQFKRRAGSIDAALEAKIGLQREHQEQLERIRTQHQQRIDAKDTQHRDDIAAKDALLERVRVEHQAQLERVRVELQARLAAKEAQLNSFKDAIDCNTDTIERNTNTIRNLTKGVFQLKNAVVQGGKAVTIGLQQLTRGIADTGTNIEMIANTAENSGREMTLALANTTKHATSRLDRKTHGFAILSNTTTIPKEVKILAGLDHAVNTETNTLTASGYRIQTHFKQHANPTDIIANARVLVDKRNDDREDVVRTHRIHSPTSPSTPKLTEPDVCPQETAENQSILYQNVTHNQHLETLSIPFSTNSELTEALALCQQSRNATQARPAVFAFSAVDDRRASANAQLQTTDTHVVHTHRELDTTVDDVTVLADQLIQLTLDSDVTLPQAMRFA